MKEISSNDLSKLFYDCLIQNNESAIELSEGELSLLITL
jgi:hypothetical protein